MGVLNSNRCSYISGMSKVIYLFIYFLLNLQGNKKGI